MHVIGTRHGRLLDYRQAVVRKIALSDIRLIDAGVEQMHDNKVLTSFLP